MTLYGKAAVLVAASIVACGAGAQSAAGSAERGQKLYMEKMCYTCHGTVGQGGERGAGPRLYPNPFPFQAFVNQVRKPRQAMPPYTAKHVSDQDLADIYAYLFSTKPSPAAKDIRLLKEF